MVNTKEKKGTQLSNGFIPFITYWLLDSINGDYLEIGCYYGVFLSEIAEQYPHIKVYGIDPHISDAYKTENKDLLQKEVKEYFAYNIKGLNNIIFWNGKTEDYLSNEYIEQLSNVSCVLIDGSHIFEDILFDIMLVEKIKSKHKMLVVFDDLHVEDVIQAIDIFKKIFKSRIFLEFSYKNCSFFHLNPNS